MSGNPDMCVHIQTNTRTISYHWGLPHMWLYGQDLFLPAIHVLCERGPNLNPHLDLVHQMFPRKSNRVPDRESRVICFP